MDIFLAGGITPHYSNNDCMLFNIDCKELLKNIKDESIDLFCSDIPYKISSKGRGIKKNGIKYMGGMFNYFENNEQNKENIQKRKSFSI